MADKHESANEKLKRMDKELGFTGTLSEMGLPDSILKESKVGCIRTSEMLYAIYCSDKVGDGNYGALQQRFGLSPEIALDVVSEVKNKAGDDYFGVYEGAIRENFAKHPKMGYLVPGKSKF